jgi:effector-binding domain-containing protein
MRKKYPGLLFKSFKETYHSVCALLQQHESEQKKPVLLFGVKLLEQKKQVLLFGVKLLELACRC